MATTTLTINNLSDLEHVASEFLILTKKYHTIAFYAPMGTGKTTFITALCHALGITEIVNSPTFAIANRYSLPNGEIVYHIDCYRLNKVDEAINLGFDDYFSSSYKCFIEWPEVVEPILPENTLKVDINENKNGSRTLSFELE